MTMDDRAEIAALLDRHQLCIDLRDDDGYAAVYTEDGSYESPFAAARGTAQLVEMMARLHASGFTSGKRHFSGPSLITIDGDRATAVSSWWAADTQPGPTLFATGRYDDELVRVDGNWRIARRRQTVDSAT
jgi:3-phenylpropionate/cinnamic acid dioxygenase small subunit